MSFNRNRLIIVALVFVVLWLGLVIRAIYIQVIPNTKLENLKQKQFSKIITLQPRRGLITDRNGKELAASITTYSLFADPSIIENKNSISIKLSNILKQKPNEIKFLLKNKDKRFVWIKRHVTESERDQIEELKLRGVNFIQESKRIYPYNSLLSQTLGFLGSDGKGLEGLESKFNEQLSGEKRQLQVQRDARGRPLIVDGRLFTERPDGISFTLTVDSELQYTLEQELKTALDEFDARGAHGIVLDTKTSEVLAIATLPGFDANKPFDFPTELRRNKTLTDPYEPGSTLKPFVVATALREKILNANSKYFCENGVLKVGKRTIREADSKHKFGWLTVSEILAKSSNVGSAKIGFQLGAEKLNKGLRDFGFGEKSGLPVGGESKGLLPQLPWSEISLATISFGHGIAVTPIQVAAAYASIANEGVYKSPKIIKKIYDSETQEELDLPKQTSRRVLTIDQAKLMMFMLTSVTQTDGTAPNARITGFPVAGKTGTAQKVDNVNGGYLRGEYISSFAGIVPAQSPQYVIYVAIDQPQGQYYGSEVAVPVFAKVASYLVRQSGLPPVLLTEKNVVDRKNIKTTTALTKLKNNKFISVENKEPITIVPDLKGLSVREVVEKFQATPYEIKIYGRGSVYHTTPEAGTSLNPNDTIKVFFND